MDGLTELLRSVQLQATVFSRAECSAPWSVYTKPLPYGIFHAVVEGECVISLQGEKTSIQLQQGDVVFIPHGHPHTMCDALSTHSVHIMDAIQQSRLNYQEEDEDVALLEIKGGGRHTSIICGSFRFEQSEVHPLLSLMPKILHVPKAENPRSAWIETTLQFIQKELEEGEPGGQVVITKLTEVLLVQALRAYTDLLQPGTGGWLEGLTDPRIGKSLGLIHKKPQHSWTASTLAKLVGMSRSAFFSKFSTLVGEPPGQYLTRWRMHLAAKALQKGHFTVSEVAFQVGYTSEGSFSKAFKRLLGTAPGEYRRQFR